MIFANGKLYESSAQDELLAVLPGKILETLQKAPLEASTVIDAVDSLARRAASGAYDALIASLGLGNAELYKEQVVRMMSRDYMEFKLRTELGDTDTFISSPPAGAKRLRISYAPLGVLLHIAAGNADGLPAYTLAEGLLTGNINILKLPRADNGLSVAIIGELCAIEPRLADYIYVFDTPSTDIPAIMKMADLADGIVTWGSDAAITAVRRFASTGTRLIEWGHKLSFAYVSGYTEDELRALAEHICATRGLLCSSCQTVFVDTKDMEGLTAFCRDFFPHLKAAAQTAAVSVGEAAAQTLIDLTDRLERAVDGASPPDFCAKGCALIPKEDSELELSPMFGSVYVKRLPERDMIPVIRRKRGYLQTAGLICSPDRRPALADKLIRAGVVRVTGAGDMSAAFAGEAHDGDYALRRYVRVINEEVI